MVKVEDDEVFYSKEMGMVRLSDGLRSMDLTGESRVPADLHLLNALGAILAEVRRTNQYLHKLTNSVVD